MRFIPAEIQGLLIIEPERHADNRGYFIRTFCDYELRQAGIEFPVRQCSVSFNPHKATLRGMHFQSYPKPEAKIVRCTKGAVFDVVIDLRKNSSTYMRWVGRELSQENGLGFYIPAGFAHGFVTLLPDTEVFYMMDAFYDPTCSGGVRWNDKAFGIAWPLEPVLMSEKDASWPDYAR